MPSSHLILYHPLFLLPLMPSSIRVFSNESALHMRWPKYWSFSFSIIPSKEHPGLISFRMDWLQHTKFCQFFKFGDIMIELKSSNAGIRHTSVWIPASPLMGFPGGLDGKACRQWGRHGSIPGWERSPGEGNGNPLVVLPRKFHGERSLVDYSPWGCKESDITEHSCWSSVCELYLNKAVI